LPRRGLEIVDFDSAPAPGTVRNGVDMKMQGSLEFTVTERSEGRVVSEMPIGSGVKNPFGVVHAGAMLWLADVTATILVMGPDQASESTKGFPLAISLNANFLGNQKEGSFRAVSSFVKRGRTVSVVRTTVYGAGEKVVADVTTSHVLSR
jgi:1,4-dihydroxy-2-naphthoyl-CoA hydrolase